MTGGEENERAGGKGKSMNFNTEDSWGITEGGGESRLWVGPSSAEGKGGLYLMYGSIETKEFVFSRPQCEGP